MIRKLFIYNKDFSSATYRGRKEVIKDGVTTYENESVPKNLYWRCMDVIESDAMTPYEFCFRAMVAVAKQLSMNKDIGKPTPECFVYHEVMRGNEFLHIYLYSKEMDAEFEKTYLGRQVDKVKFDMKGEKVTEIKSVGYEYDHSESTRVFQDFDGSPETLIQPLIVNEPEAGKIVVKGNMFLIQFEQGSDIFEHMARAKREMDDRIDSMPSRAEVLDERRALALKLKENRKANKKENPVSPFDPTARYAHWLSP